LLQLLSPPRSQVKHSLYFLHLLILTYLLMLIPGAVVRDRKKYYCSPDISGASALEVFT